MRFFLVLAALACAQALAQAPLDEAGYVLFATRGFLGAEFVASDALATEAESRRAPGRLQAQRQLLAGRYASGQYHFSRAHPFFWAPFVFVGD